MKPGKPSRRPPLGQHFLADERVRQEIVKHLRPRPEDCWIEIGPGHGEITRLLAERVKHIVAIEKDTTLVAELRATLPTDKVRVVEGDVLTTSLSDLAKEHNVGKWRIYGSLPYYITSPILHRLFGTMDVIEDVFVVVQKEVAQRLTATPGSRDYAYLTVATQLYSVPTLLRDVPAECFKPPPKIDSALVALSPPGAAAALSIEDPDGYLAFVKQCFQQKRKTLLNNLSGLYSGERVIKALGVCKLTALSRGEEITLRQFACLYKSLLESA